MPHNDELERRAGSFRRNLQPPTLRADFYEGDEFANGSRISIAHSAILGVNNVTHSKGIIAGSIDNIADVGIGGRSDAKDNVGAYGYSKNGTGVLGCSENGLAGLFKGNVNITENLTIKGVSFQAIFQTIQQLQNDIKTLQQIINFSQPPIPNSATPNINVIIDNSKQIVKGTGFLPNKVVTIKVGFDDFTNLNFQQSADNSGKLDMSLNLNCVRGLRMHFSATDSRPNTSDITGLLWSNIFTTTCP